MAGQSDISKEASQGPRRRKAWYVLRAISGKEGKVKEILDAAIRNSDLGKYLLQVLIPTEKVVTTRNGKRIVQERNLLSGYVFIECALTAVPDKTGAKGEDGRVKMKYILAGDAVDTLRNTTNVIDFLRGRSKTSDPLELRYEEVERMLGRVDATVDPVNEDDESYTVGDAVKATAGPFSGFAGVVKDVNSEKNQVTLEVKIFGRPTEVSLDFSQVERV